MKVFHSPEYTAAGHGFDTTRKAGWVAAWLTRNPVPGAVVTAPAPATVEELTLVHDPGYVAAVRTGEPRDLAESQGFCWDAALWQAVAASTGGTLAAARAARREGVAGSLSSGLHHARAHRGQAWCTFNGLALAAREALDDGVAHVLVIDTDAHGGGGTHVIARRWPGFWQLDVSTTNFDSFVPGTRETRDVVRDARHYLPTLASRLDALERTGPAFGLVLVNAGMDPFERCRAGGLEDVTAEILAAREALVFGWCARLGYPCAFVLAGGYTGPQLGEDELAGLHGLTVAAAARAFKASA